MIRKELIIAFVMFITFSAPVRAEEVALSLDETISIALRDNRDILLKSEDVKKAKAKISESYARLYPTLNFTGTYAKTQGYYANKDISQTTGQTTLTQIIYRGGKTINTIKQSQYGLEVTQAILDTTKLEIVLSVKKAFYTFLLAEEFAQLNKKILANTQGHLAVVEARYQGGQASESEVLKIKESLAVVEEALSTSLSQAESAKALLRNLLYLDNNVAIAPHGEFTYEHKEIAYEEAFLKALEARPEIKQYQALNAAAEKSVEIAKADGRPTIYAAWDYYSRSHVATTTGLARNWNDHNIISLVFSWPVFDGWATKHKVEQAIVDVREAQLTKEKTFKDVALELKTAYLDFKNALAKIRASETQVDTYRDILAVTEEKYKAGIVSSLDLDDASLGYTVSLFNQKQAMYDYAIAKAKFDKATGEM